MLRKGIGKLAEVLRNTHVKQGAVWSSVTLGQRNQALFTSLQEAPKNVQEPRISETILQNLSPRRTIRSLRRRKVMPLSQTQKGIWYESEMKPDSVAYKLCVAFEVTGSLDVEKMQKAWSLLVERHEALRTTIIEENGQPMQCISPCALNNIEIINDVLIDPEQYISEILIKKPFKLENSPLSRCYLVCCGNNQSYLVLDFHHIIMDASSTHALLQGLSYYYNALVKGEQVIVPPEDTTMTQYLEAEERYLQEESLALAKDFWLKNLASVQTTVDIGSTNNNHQSPHKKSNTAHFELQEANKLFDHFSAKGYSMFVTLSAALGITLHRYSGQNSLALGYPSLFDRSKLKNLVNCGINMLPLPMHFDSDSTASQLLNNLKTHRREARKFDYYPMSYLLQALRQVDPAASVPNVDITECFVDLNGLNFNGTSVKSVAVDTHSILSDLVLYYFPFDNKVRFELKYNSDKFTEEWINQFVSSFKLIVQEMSHNIDQPIHKLPIMTQDLQKKLLVEWNQTQVNYPLDKTTVSQLFEDQVQKNPDARAVVFKDQVLTYRELNNKSNQLASYLKSLGVSEGSKVAVYLERGPDYVISLLAIFKAGGAFVPLSSKFPAERFAYVLKDSEAKLLLTTKAQSKIFESDIPTCYLDELRWSSCENHLLPSMVNRSNQLAYVIYTSGTTGKPKGVPIEHRALTNFALWYRDYFKLSPHDNTTQYFEISFDASLEDTFPALISGSCLHIIQDDHRISIEALNDYYNRENITFSALPSAVFERFQTLHNTSLRAVAIGGEKLSHFTNNQNYEVHNVYGPTETTIVSTVAHLTSSNNINIGYPAANTKTYVLDKWLQPVPVGVVGELYISGAGLSRGYLNLPHLTEEKFIQNPFASKEDKKLGTNLTLYKTGDLVHYLPDGRLKYVSRVDSQVKLRGFRIELSEIESVIRREVPVKDVAVIIREDSPNDKRLVAYLVHESQILSQIEQDVLIQNIQKTLKSHLPDYMVPSAFVFLEKLPLTLSDKVDQRALPKPNYRSKNFIAPSTETEKSAVSIWAEILQIDPATISVADSFFELGGTSLHVAQVVKLFKQKLNIQISLIDIFTNPTLTGLLNTHSSTQSREVPALMEIQPEGNKPPLFLFHPIDGLSYFYIPLKDAVPDQPIYGINNPYFASEDKFFGSFKEMVHHYSQLVKQTRKGPYQLGGWSLGGFLALEIAAELKKQGEIVENVILLDILNMNKIPKDDSEEDDTPYEFQLPDSEKEWYAHLLNMLHIEKQSEFYTSLTRTFYLTDKILKNYEISPYDGRVILLKARNLAQIDDINNQEHYEKLFADPLSGFEGMFPNLEVMSIPGDHMDILELQNLTEFKDIFSKALSQPSLIKQYPDHDLLTRNFLLALKQNDDHQIKLFQKNKALPPCDLDKMKDLL